MNRSFFVLAVLFISFLQVSAQSDYKSAIGLRLGVAASGSYKYFVSQQGALEGYAGFANEGFGFNYFTIGGMYQHHFPIAPVEGLKWYVGGGLLANFYSYNRRLSNSDYSAASLGINGVGGVDYKFKKIPLNLSVDWMPVLLLNNGLYYANNFRGGNGALSVRYVLN